MPQNGLKPLRDWRDIADEASRELDPGKLQQLTEELKLALDERAKKLHSQDTPLAKAESA